MFLTRALFLIVILLPFGALADAPGCLDSQKAQNLFKEFQVFKTSERVNVDLCDSHSMAYTLVKGLLFLQDLGALNSDNSSLNRNWIQGTPYEFFSKRVKQIVLDDGPDCTGLSQMWPSERNMKIMHLCTKALEYDTLVLSEALMHEAWHMESIPHDHAVCRTSGELYGRESCDESYESGGAYAIGVEFLMKIYQTPRLDFTLREQAHNMALKALRERFNMAPGVVPMTLTQQSKEKPKIFR